MSRWLKAANSIDPNSNEGSSEPYKQTEVQNENQNECGPQERLLPDHDTVTRISR